MHFTAFGRLHWCRPLEKFMIKLKLHMAPAQPVARPVARPVAHSTALAALAHNTAGVDIHMQMEDSRTVCGRRPT